MFNTIFVNRRGKHHFSVNRVIIEMLKVSWNQKATQFLHF